MSTTSNADFVDQSRAADAPFHKSPDRECSVLRRRELIGQRLLDRELAINEQPDSLGFERHRNVMPLVVSDVDVRAILPAAARQEDAEEARACIRIHLPVSRGTLQFARDQDVEAIFAAELRPTLDGQRDRSLSRLRVDHNASRARIKCLSELALSEPQGASRG